MNPIHLSAIYAFASLFALLCIGSLQTIAAVQINSIPIEAKTTVTNLAFKLLLSGAIISFAVSLLMVTIIIFIFVNKGDCGKILKFLMNVGILFGNSTILITGIIGILAAIYLHSVLRSPGGSSLTGNHLSLTIIKNSWKNAGISAIIGTVITFFILISRGLSCKGT